MNALMIRDVRSFNRTVTEGLGVLGDRFLGRARPLGESRVLWEIGLEGIEIRTLRRRLGLDSGYVSRVLQSLSRQGLVRVRVDRADRRVRRAVLTSRGLAERAELDRRSDALALRLLNPLAEKQRARLVSAMAEVDRLLQASLVQFGIEDPESADARWCFDQYFAELRERFEHGFDPAVSISADAAELRPPAGVLLLARLRDRPIGCGALKLHGAAPAELKRMWIDRSVRGLGAGARLLQELEDHAWKAGATTVRLETNRALREAIALYQRSGYVAVAPFNDEPYAHHWFEKHRR